MVPIGHSGSNSVSSELAPNSRQSSRYKSVTRWVRWVVPIWGHTHLKRIFLFDHSASYLQLATSTLLVVGNACFFADTLSSSEGALVSLKILFLLGGITMILSTCLHLAATARSYGPVKCPIGRRPRTQAPIQAETADTSETNHETNIHV